MRAPLLTHKKQKNNLLPLELAFEHGSNNVSRWMTWLPISLKNAAKCDKWYQLQNHSITESLNAKGAWEKLFTSHPRACRISVSNNKKPSAIVSLLKWWILSLVSKKQTKQRVRCLVENIQKNHVGVLLLQGDLYFPWQRANNKKSLSKKDRKKPNSFWLLF